MPLETPVAMFLFNRPELTAQVFARIAEAKPSKLFLIADGPGAEDGRDRCMAARAAVSKIDWDCEVRTNFSQANLGCRRRMSSGIDWVFDQVESAILLEDDCLPHPSFFPFCVEMLRKYRDEEQIMQIGGSNLQRGHRRSAFSYYYSWITHIWGWATWRRAWKHYDVSMRRWPELRDTDWLEQLLVHPAVASSYRRSFQDTFSSRIDTWDYQWAFACWARRALTILPEVNLISNVGFGADATHTRSSNSPDAALPTAAMDFPLKHPPQLERCAAADDFTFANSFRIKLSSAA